MTLSIMTLSLFVTLSKIARCYNVECQYAEVRVLFIIVLNLVMPSVIIPNVVMSLCRVTWRRQGCHSANDGAFIGYESVGSFCRQVAAWVHGASTIKHYGFVMYRLVCLYSVSKVTVNNKDTSYYVIIYLYITNDTRRNGQPPISQLTKKSTCQKVNLNIK